MYGSMTVTPYFIKYAFEGNHTLPGNKKRTKLSLRQRKLTSGKLISVAAM
jgi:hypothetical protein